ncbi:MAG TPA: hypothetical protein VKB80_14720 [Kofleriaceae bacterium]|nr:hypothetical protein [Kofleriaceae bacterium]
MSTDSLDPGRRRGRGMLACGAVIAACAVVAASARPGAAWEAATTHAGLTEQAALASGLHDRLRSQFGGDQGLFQVLTVPPADAPELFNVLRKLNPTHGYVPDARGRLSAIGWLVAGSVVADAPAELAANHFFDPSTGRGLSDDSVGDLGLRLTAMFRGGVARSGMPAPDWIESARNPMGLAGFRAQYAKAVSARTPGERSRHLAGVLLAAGAMTHVLEDMGSPSHARNDLAAHLERLGPDGADLGSRFERVAALAYGRLGVPGAGKPVGDRPLRDYFTAKDGSGLADRTAAAWFSDSTLPRPIELGADARGALVSGLRASLRRPAPSPAPGRLAMELRRAGEDGLALRDAQGVCLARYRVIDHRLSWSIDDACALEQVAAILPLVGSYAAGMLDALFRGSLTLESEGAQIVVRTGAVDLGRGKVSLYWDDARGIRTLLREVTVEHTAAGQIAASLPGIPDSARRVSALFEGSDTAGRPLQAAGTSAYPIPAR